MNTGWSMTNEKSNFSVYKKKILWTTDVKMGNWFPELVFGTQFSRFDSNDLLLWLLKKSQQLLDHWRAQSLNGKLTENL